MKIRRTSDKKNSIQYVAFIPENLDEAELLAEIKAGREPSLSHSPWMAAHAETYAERLAIGISYQAP